MVVRDNVYHHDWHLSWGMLRISHQDALVGFLRVHYHLYRLVCPNRSHSRHDKYSAGTQRLYVSFQTLSISTTKLNHLRREFLTGYIQPGRPVAMMLFKTYGYITMAQGLYFTQDLKLGQYMKIPWRSMFMAQTIATIWACIVQVAVLEWGLGGAIADVCTEHQANKFNCPNGRVFFNASVIWGLIGPQRIFSPGSIYANLQWFWLAGAIAPVIFYALARAFPRAPFRYLSAPLIFGGSGEIPPATPLNYLAWGIVGYVFNKHIRNKYRGWWMRFNYITSAGLDTGLAICTIVIILAINLTNTSMPSWWGVSVANNNMDNLDTAVKYPNPNPSAPGRFFGPTVW